MKFTNCEEVQQSVSCLDALFDFYLSNIVDHLGVYGGWPLVSSGIVHIKYLVGLSNIFDTDLV